MLKVDQAFTIKVNDEKQFEKEREHLETKYVDDLEHEVAKL